MGKLIKLLAGVWLIWLPVAGIMYLFSNGAADEVENATLEQLIHAHRRLDMLMGKEMEKMYRNRVQKNVEYLASGGIDVRTPISKLLKSDPEISGVAVESVTAIKMKDAELQRVTFSLARDGFRYSFEFLARNKSFMAPWQAELFGLGAVTVTDPSSGRSARFEDEARMIFALASLTSKGKIPMNLALPPEVLRTLVRTEEPKTSPASPPIIAPDASGVTPPSVASPAALRITPALTAKVLQMARGIGDAQFRHDAQVAFPLAYRDGSGLGAIVRTADGRAWLILNTVTEPNMHTCEVQGSAQMSSGLLSMKVDECRLEMSITGDGLARVNTESCSSMCGLNGTLNGIYAIGDEINLAGR